MNMILYRHSKGNKHKNKKEGNNIMTALFIVGAVGFCAFLGAAIIKTIVH